MPLLSGVVPLTPLTKPGLGAQARRTTEVTETLLPREVYSYNDRTAEWEVTPSETGELVINWVYDKTPGSLVINWEVESPTVMVHTGVLCTISNQVETCEASTLEVPTSMSVLLLLNELPAANLNITALYHEALDCGYFTYEPAGITIEGVFGAETLVELSTDFAVTTDVRSGVDTAASSFALKAEAGNDWTTMSWDWDVSGVIARDEFCFPVGAESIIGGNLSFSVASSVSNKASGFDFVVAASEVVQDDEGVPTAALLEGFIDVDGERNVDFAGVLDDEDEDGIPGENVVLTFSDSTTTLDAFLRELLVQSVVQTLRAR